MNCAARIVGTAATLVALVLLAGCQGGAGEAGSPTAAGAPVILITVDGLIAEELSAFGGPKETPVLARLAGDGHAWTDGWTVCPMTRPAVASYLTGVAPDRHGVRDDLFTPLPEGIPTLATLLSAEGYRTAAFPGSSPLGRSSGLLGGFDVVDDAPAIPVSPARWVPTTIGSADLPAHFGAWVSDLPEASSYFAWIHFSHPMIGTIVETARKPVGEARDRSDERPAGKGKARSERAGAEQEEPPDVIEVDAALAQILDILEARGDAARSLIIVAGTVGDVSGGESDPAGPGFSLSDAALSVPVIVSFPPGIEVGRAAEEPVWAPDVAATVAGVAGVKLGDESEGISLTDSAPADRVLFAWSWATLDQAGWRPLRAARLGSLVRREGQADGNRQIGSAEPVPEDADTARLASALAARAEPARAAVGIEEVRQLLGEQGVTLDPQPAGGRAFDDPESRRTVAERLWRARVTVASGRGGLGRLVFSRVLKADPDSPAALLDGGQFALLSGQGNARELLGQAVAQVPTDPEMLHWYAHAMWSDSVEQAEKLLQLILPHKQLDGDVLYDLACARSLAQDIPSSEKYLRASIEAGFRNWRVIETDSDLRNLRESGRFSEVLREYGR